MHAGVTDVDNSLGALCGIVSKNSVAYADLQRAVETFESLMSQVSRSPVIPTVYHNGDYEMVSIQNFFYWMYKSESSESAQDLSFCLLRAHQALKSAAAIARWTR